jgi:AcrR family transcriptional regulator
VPADVVVLSRRDRLRVSTTQEIIQIARRLLVEQGSTAISLRAIAREMGMTAPALYRYFGSHEELIQHVIADIFTELADYTEEAVRAAGKPVTAGPAAAAATEPMAASLLAASKAFRAWAIDHPPEFGLLFGTPLPGVEMRHDNPLDECGMRFGRIFLRLFDDLWRIRPFSIQADEEIDPSLRSQLARYRDLIGTDLPLGVLQTFLRCWVLLYGTVSLEAFGHLKFALDDSEQLFELMLTDLAAMIGLEYPTPS